MPHGISARRARRLAEEVSDFLQQRMLQVGMSPGAAEGWPEKHVKFQGMDFKKSAALSVYLKMGASSFGQMGLPTVEEVAEAAEVFGRAMSSSELLNLATAIRKQGL